MKKWNRVKGRTRHSNKTASAIAAWPAVQSSVLPYWNVRKSDNYRSKNSLMSSDSGKLGEVQKIRIFRTHIMIFVHSSWKFQFLLTLCGQVISRGRVEMLFSEVVIGRLDTSSLGFLNLDWNRPYTMGGIIFVGLFFVTPGQRNFILQKEVPLSF